MQTAKRALREAMLAARRAMPPAERLERSIRIADRLAALDAFVRARTVALYAAMGAEVDTTPLARAAVAAGKRLAFPRLAAPGRALDFALCSLEDLVPGPNRTREPPAAARGVPPADLDLVIVPGVAFDLACNRLGRGRAHYDATLAAGAPSAVRIGLGFELQLVTDVPREPHDAPLDAVVTEDRVVFRLPGGLASGRSSR